jgi:hypothetical protein
MGVPPPLEREDAEYDNAAAAPIPGLPEVVRLPDPVVEGDSAEDPEPAEETDGPVAEEEQQPEIVPPPPSGPAAAPAEAVDAVEGKAAPPEKMPRKGEAAAPGKGKSPPVAAPRAKEAESPTDAPWWTRKKEELVYRVDFIGITMGYARFRYQGRVSVGGKVAYHLNVRAWTSGMLAFIYPVNETIDYYLDAETLAPLRQETTKREKEKDDVALYDQETGTIVYRYRQSGEIRKKVDVPPPPVYDPVSAAYYFRWRDIGGEERARNVYAGRKLYQIAARVLGNERLRTENGEVDTIVIQPVIRRGGKVEDKGDLRMWVSNDERRVPVRVFAKFRKIKDWTLVGELMPASGG